MTTSNNPNLGGFRDPSLGDAGDLATFLTTWAATPEAAERYRLKHQLLAIQPGEKVLDLGCGAGVDLIPMAQLVGTSGRVVGVDVNDAMMSIARERAAELGLTQVETLHIQPGRLPFDDMSFDVVHVERVLMHVEDIDLAVSEIARVLRPGGRAVACEIDRASIAWDLTNLELLERLTYPRGGPYPLMGRQLFRRFKKAGFTDLKVHGSWLIGPGDSDLDGGQVLIEQRLRTAIAQGDLTEDEAQQIRGLRASALEAGEYFYAVPFFLIRGTRPT